MSCEGSGSKKQSQEEKKKVRRVVTFSSTTMDLLIMGSAEGKEKSDPVLVRGAGQNRN